MASLMKKLKTVYPYQQNTSSGEKRVKAMPKLRSGDKKKKEREKERKGRGGEGKVK